MNAELHEVSNVLAMRASRPCAGFASGLASKGGGRWQEPLLLMVADEVVFLNDASGYCSADSESAL